MFFYFCTHYYHCILRKKWTSCWWNFYVSPTRDTISCASVTGLFLSLTIFLVSTVNFTCVSPWVTGFTISAVSVFIAFLIIKYNMNLQLVLLRVAFTWHTKSYAGVTSLFVSTISLFFTLFSTFVSQSVTFSTISAVKIYMAFLKKTTIGVYDDRSHHQHKILILCHRSVCHYNFSFLYMVFCMCESPCHKFLHLCSQNLFCILENKTWTSDSWCWYWN